MLTNEQRQILLNKIGAARAAEDEFKSLPTTPEVIEKSTKAWQELFRFIQEDL